MPVEDDESPKWKWKKKGEEEDDPKPIIKKAAKFEPPVEPDDIWSALEE